MTEHKVEICRERSFVRVVTSRRFKLEGISVEEEAVYTGLAFPDDAFVLD